MNPRSASAVAIALSSLSPALGLELKIQVPAAHAGPELRGRLLVVLASKAEPEPRFQVDGTVGSAQIFGVDVDGVGEDGIVRMVGADGWPLARPQDLPVGQYFAQAVFHRYEVLHPSHGGTLLLPWDRGEGQKWNEAPGNLLSTPVAVSIEPGGSVALTLDLVIAPIAPPADTKYVRHISKRSEALSQFWGRDVTLGAHVLLPEGYDEHPERRYPLLIVHGHYPSDLGSFRPDPPDPNLPCVDSARFGVPCYNRIAQQQEHEAYLRWTAPDFPRFLLVEIQHPTPYYDDSYAVNSANNGPYGDALTYDFIPFLEREFRGFAAPWARFLTGGSTGGWEALAAQILYPEQYNGAFAACPDPIDFRAHTTVNLEQHTNAYRIEGPFTSHLRPGQRDEYGWTNATVEGLNLYERALGSRGRSGEQFDAWQAVYSPRGADGYPQPIWDKTTGTIDSEVAAFWREHYDLRRIVVRDWSKIGASLRGKLHVFAGDMDDWYLDKAVVLFQQAVEALADPPAEAEFVYGNRARHCFNGDLANPIWISRFHYASLYVARMRARLLATKPADAELPPNWFPAARDEATLPGADSQKPALTR